jgi:hypothetical protein
MGSPAPVPAPAAARAAPRFNVNAVVAQVIAALKQRQSQTRPPPANMPRDLLAALEILGQEPGLRRPLGAAGNAVFGAWAQAAAAAAAERVTILRGNGQVALVGTTVRVAPAIAITDGFGRPSQGVPIAFRVTAGGGSVVRGSPNTGQDGVASLIAWTLGTTPGLNRLQVNVRRVPTADLVAFAIPTRRCEILRGDGRQGAAGTALPIEPAVRVVDALTGQPLDGLNVAFAVSAGGGNIANAAPVTDQDGIATPGVWTLGPAQGTNTLVATVEGADAAAFTAQAT